MKELWVDCYMELQIEAENEGLEGAAVEKFALDRVDGRVQDRLASVIDRRKDERLETQLKGS